MANVPKAEYTTYGSLMTELETSINTIDPEVSGITADKVAAQASNNAAQTAIGALSINLMAGGA